MTRGVIEFEGVSDHDKEIIVSYARDLLLQTSERLQAHDHGHSQEQSKLMALVQAACFQLLADDFRTSYDEDDDLVDKVVLFLRQELPKGTH